MVAIISILAALATAGLLRSWMTANEVGAIGRSVSSRRPRRCTRSAAVRAPTRPRSSCSARLREADSRSSRPIWAVPYAEQERLQLLARRRRRIIRWAARLLRAAHQLRVLRGGHADRRGDRLARFRCERHEHGVAAVRPPAAHRALLATGDTDSIEDEDTEKSWSDKELERLPARNALANSTPGRDGERQRVPQHPAPRTRHLAPSTQHPIHLF